MIRILHGSKEFKFHILPPVIANFYNRLYHPACRPRPDRPFAYAENACITLHIKSLPREARFNDWCRRNLGINYSAIRWDRYMENYRRDFMISEFELGECF